MSIQHTQPDEFRADAEMLATASDDFVVLQHRLTVDYFHALDPRKRCHKDIHFQNSSSQESLLSELGNLTQRDR